MKDDTGKPSQKIMNMIYADIEKDSIEAEKAGIISDVLFNSTEEEFNNAYNPDEYLNMPEGLIAACVAAASPEGIARQEAAGQKMFVTSQTLPKECPRADLESLGFVFGEDVDDLFVDVTFPEGWKVEASDHDMWSNLLDPRGRTRATIFYKAAFYDRHADMNLISYISAGQTYGINSNPDDNKLQFSVKAGGETVYETAVFDIEKYSDEYFDRSDNLMREVADWAKEHYPNSDDPAAYWND